MYLYHLTKKELIPEILKNGLKPQIGSNSEICYLEKPTIFLCDYESIPYWEILLNATAAVKVNVNVSEDDYIEYGYVSSYKEWKIYEDISPDDIEEIDIVEAGRQHMQELCYNYLMVISNLTVTCARYYNGQIKALTPENLNSELASFVKIISKLDYSTLTKEEIQEFLKEEGKNGEYTLCDTYKNENKRLYQKLAEYPNDTSFKSRLDLYNLINKNLKESLDVNTGGWTG